MYEQKLSNLPFIESIWRAQVTQEGEYSDPAKDTWGLAFTRRQNGSLAAELLGPSIQHRMLAGNVGDEYWGVELYAYVTMRGVNKPQLTGEFVSLRVENSSFFIGDDVYSIPSFDDLEGFCKTLASLGVISHISRSLDTQTTLSLRSKQRNHLKVTGLTRKKRQQINRAERAIALLRSGMSPSEVATEVGYSDQAHLTRSLKYLHGKTPATIKPTY